LADGTTRPAGNEGGDLKRTALMVHRGWVEENSGIISTEHAEKRRRPQRFVVGLSRRAHPPCR